jgi:hypothetical protein
MSVRRVAPKMILQMWNKRPKTPKAGKLLDPNPCAKNWKKGHPVVHRKRRQACLEVLSWVSKNRTHIKTLSISRGRNENKKTKQKTSIAFRMSAGTDPCTASSNVP